MKRNAWRRPVQVVSGLLISVLFLWLAFRKADLSRVAATLSHTDLRFLGVVFIISIFGLVVRSYRWKLLGEQYQKTPWNYFFRATSIGLMLNMFLPFRSGDLFQAYFISRNGRFARGYALSTVVLERLIDTIPPLLMLIVGSLFVVMPEAIGITKVLLIFGTIAAGMTLIIWKGKYLSALAGRLRWFGHGEKVQRLLSTLSDSLSFVKSRQVLTRALPLTFFNWFILTIASTWLLLLALDIHLTLLQVFVVQGIMVISVAIPASPGFIGTWEFFTILALSVFNINKNDALSFAILSHFMAFLPITLAGISVLAYETLVKKDREDIAAIRADISKQQGSINIKKDKKN